MAEKVFIYYIILLVVAKPAYPTNSCSVTDYVDSCKYTVRCEIYAGSAQVYSCSSEPYVIFIISHSRIDALTAGFFGSTNFDSRVREIRGIENTWNSIEPYSFKYYAKSVVVDLSGNHIKTIKNEAFKNFAYLNYLNLSNNDMESLSPSSLYLSPDTSLSVLDLSNNNLTDIQYGVLNNLPRLEYLYLQNNQIEMLSDDSLSSLKNLTKLILHHNKIETLNMMLINLKSLKELDMSFNKLKKIAGYETNRLFSLEILNMSHNAIEILESNCFNQAPNLKIVDFSNNRIMSTIEVKMFINNAKLQYLNLYNNKVKKIEDGSFEKSNLTYINLENNFISGEITNTTFVGLSEIKYLCLYNQNITALKSKAFTWMRMLANLNLSVNSIQYIDKDSFNEMNSLHVLDLSHNNISSLAFLYTTLTNLTHLYLNNNSINFLQENLFFRQDQLIKLDLSNNKIKSIQSKSLPLLNLQYINLTGNSLLGNIRDNMFSPAKFLRYLDLSNLRINRIDKMAFIDLPVLARLNLSHNEIEFIEPNNFYGLDNLYSLDISFNHLSSFNLNSSVFKNLKAVYLNNNKLKQLSNSFSNAPNVMYLDLSFNNVSNLSLTDFKSFPNLKVLHLAYNKIINFNNPQTNTLSNITVLNLSHNKISYINLTFFKELVSLDLSSNTILNISSSFFQKVDDLMSLDLSNNNISSLLPGTFKNVKILKYLNMSSNRLERLRYGSLKGLHRTEVLDFSRNNFSELDVNVFHECTELIKLIIDYNNIRSVDVENLMHSLSKLRTLSLGGNPLSCKEIVRSIKITTMRLLEVTSIDKVYHEDNVYGITCGDDSVSNKTVNYKIDQNHQDSITQESTLPNIVLIWCSLLTVACVVIGVTVFIYKKKRNGVSRLHLRHSVELNGSECPTDLLT